jgi:hypothetical protein
VEEAAKVSEFSVQAESLWTLHKVENNGSIPDKEAFGRLRDLQVNRMKDSLGYMKQMEESLQLFLRENRHRGAHVQIPEAYLERSPVQKK